MKKIMTSLILIFASWLAFSQQVAISNPDKNNKSTGEIKKAKVEKVELFAPEDKAVVYFVRTSALGLAINFSYFDSATLIGRFNGPKYIRYECEPGTHLFWVRSENREFVEANVEAGKIYFIDVVPTMGALKARVMVSPIDPQNTGKTTTKVMSRILKLLNRRPSESFTAEQLKSDAESLKEAIERGLEKYNEDKGHGKTFQKLEQTMFYNN